MKLKLSRLASFKTERLLEYLEENWSTVSREKFLQKLNEKYQAVLKTPEEFTKSELHPELRRIVITRQTSALYKIEGDTVYIITIFDNRQNPNSIAEEINKNFY